MGAASKAGNGEEGREDAGEGKAARSSKDKRCSTATVSKASLPKSGLKLLPRLLSPYLTCHPEGDEEKPKLKGSFASLERGGQRPW